MYYYFKTLPYAYRTARWLAPLYFHRLSKFLDTHGTYVREDATNITHEYFMYLTANVIENLLISSIVSGLVRAQRDLNIHAFDYLLAIKSSKNSCVFRIYQHEFQTSASTQLMSI